MKARTTRIAGVILLGSTAKRRVHLTTQPEAEASIRAPSLKLRSVADGTFHRRQQIP